MALCELLDLRDPTSEHGKKACNYPHHIQDVAIAYHLEEQSLGHRLATEVDYTPSHPRNLASKAGRVGGN